MCLCMVVVVLEIFLFFSLKSFDDVAIVFFSVRCVYVFDVCSVVSSLIEDAPVTAVHTPGWSRV